MNIILKVADPEPFFDVDKNWPSCGWLQGEAFPSLKYSKAATGGVL